MLGREFLKVDERSLFVMPFVGLVYRPAHQRAFAHLPGGLNKKGDRIALAHLLPAIIIGRSLDIQFGVRAHGPKRRFYFGWWFSWGGDGPQRAFLKRLLWTRGGRFQ